MQRFAIIYIKEGKTERKLQHSFQCPKCRAQIAVGQQSCSSCGQHFEYRCRHCGSTVNTPSGFCSNCGEKLHHQAQMPTRPANQKVVVTPQPIRYRHQTETTRPIDQVSRYLILIAIIIFMGAILYAIGTGLQGENANWVGGGFTFGGQSPPSTPPPSTPSNINTQPELKSGSDSPQYTTAQVIAAAKRVSPYCRSPSTRRS